MNTSINDKMGGLSLKKAFSDTVLLYKKNLFMLILPIFIFQLIATYFKIIMIFSPIILGAYCYMALKALQTENNKINLSIFFASIKKNYFRLFLMGIITIVPIIVAIIFFVVPALFIGTLWMFASLLIIDKNLSALASLGISWNIILHKKLLKNMLLFLISAAIMMLLFYIDGIILNDIMNLPKFVGVISNTISFSLSQIFIASAYKQQVVEDNGDLYGII